MTDSMVARDIRTAPQTIEVWTPNNGEPVTVNVGRHICDDWYNYAATATGPDDRTKLRGISSGTFNSDELDGLFAYLRRIPQLERFTVEGSTISLWVSPQVRWSSIQPYVERAITQLPYFSSRPSFAVHP